jgi:hypothetical protein
MVMIEYGNIRPEGTMISYLDFFAARDNAMHVETDAVADIDHAAACEQGNTSSRLNASPQSNPAVSPDPDGRARAEKLDRIKTDPAAAQDLNEGQSDKVQGCFEYVCNHVLHVLT